MTSVSAKCKQLRQPPFLVSGRTSGHPCLGRAKVPTARVWDSVLGPRASSIRCLEAAMCEEYARVPVARPTCALSGSTEYSVGAGGSGGGEGVAVAASVWAWRAGGGGCSGMAAPLVSWMDGSGPALLVWKRALALPYWWPGTGAVVGMALRWGCRSLGVCTGVGQICSSGRLAPARLYGCIP